MRKEIVGLLALCGGALSIPACFFTYMDDCTYNIGLDCFWANQAGSGGTAGTGGTGGARPECIPGQATAPLSNECGKFVAPAPDGDDTAGDGSKEKPYATITKAMAEASVIYVCAADGKAVEDAVTVTADVEVFGGLKCADWAYDPSKKSGWSAPADAVPLTASGDGARATVHDVAITAKDATVDGGSSIGVIAADKAGLTLERCDVTAGNGKDGATGEKPAGTGTPGAIGQNGEDGCIDAKTKVGGNAGTNMCDGMERDGGSGGNGTTNNGSDGSDGQPLGDMGKGGIGQIGQGTCAAGQFGANGTAGTPGDGGTEFGDISPTGYVGSAGRDGKTPGSPGQGGGGGGGAKVCASVNAGTAGPGGGGGGAGGCGGQPGKGGKPGGASIALISDGATVTLTNVNLTAANGGNGGMGGGGQAGGKGGLGGTAGMAGANNADTEAKACSGGDGGKGGNGGPGGGGHGGPSLALAFKGKEPLQTKVNMKASNGGKGGHGGDMTMMLTSWGADALSCKSLSFDKGAPSCVK